MNKPTGGRGKVAPKPTVMRRIPEGIKATVEILSDLYRADDWDGTLESLNPISSKFSDSQKVDIKYQPEQVEQVIALLKESLRLKANAGGAIKDKVKQALALLES